MLVHDLKSFLKVDEKIAYKHCGITMKAHTQSREHHTGKAVTTILLLTAFQPWIPQPLVLEASATSIFWKLVQQIRRKMVVNEVVLLMVGPIMLVIDVHYNRTRHLESRRWRFIATKYVMLCSTLK